MWSMRTKHRDLLSYLPDEILQHIFSSLEVKDILKLRVLSKRFNKTLCAAIPSFSFSDCSCSCTHISDFMINTVHLNRPHALNINRISFFSVCKNQEHVQLHKYWIIRIFQVFHVDELSLHYELPSFFRILPNFSKFQFLKVLKLNMKINRISFSSLSSVMLPKMKLASLETLHIKSIYVPDCSLDEWISQSFPSLKNLSLQETFNRTAKQDFTIRSSSLEDLAILNFGYFKLVRIITENLRTLNCFFGDVCEGDYTNFVFKICAPDLQSFTWVGGPYIWYSHRYEEEKVKNFQATTTIPRALIMQESNSNVLIQLFKAIHLARELHIDTQVTVNWVRLLHAPTRVLEGIHGEPSVSHKNICHLKIHVQQNIVGEYYITLLERLPNLETLTFENYTHYRTNLELKERSVKDKFEEALRDCKKVELRRIKGLKKVKFLIIRNFSYSIIILIGLLMKTCTELEEVMLYYPSCFHKSMTQEGVLYLKSFERASPMPPSFHFFPHNYIA